MECPSDVETPESTDRGKKHGHCNHEVSCKRMVDSQKIHELEACLNAITKVGDWRLEQLKLMDSEKRAAEKTLEEERKLFAEMSLDQIQQNTAQIQALQEHWFTLMSSRNPDGNTLVAQQSSTASASTRAVDGMREQLKLRSDERDKWKTKCKKLEEEAYGAQQQIRKLTTEVQSCKAERVKLANAQKEGSNLEEVCRDLLEQLEQRNTELQRCRAESSRGQNLHKLAEMRQEITKRDDEIGKLKRILDDHDVKKAEAKFQKTLSN